MVGSYLAKGHKGEKVAKVLATYRIFPNSDEIDLKKLLNSINEKLPENFKIYAYKEEPIAFGLKALIIQILMPDEAGYSRKIEEFLEGFEEISEVTVINVQRFHE